MFKELDFKTNNTYFKIHCLYNAKTELFDRSLTDMRSKHDPTEAFIDVSNRVRNSSNQYARLLYENCKRIIEAETNKPFSRDLWAKTSYNNLSAQDWINIYEQMVKNGEFDWL